MISGGADATGIDFALGSGLSVSDVSAAEGTSAVFTVTLSRPVGQTVTVDYAIEPGTAAADLDFTAAAGTLSFPPTVTSLTVAVPITQDALNEASETFFLRLSNATHALIVDGEGLGTILDDDPLPSLSIGNVSVLEGNSDVR